MPNTYRDIIPAIIKFSVDIECIFLVCIHYTFRIDVQGIGEPVGEKSWQQKGNTDKFEETLLSMNGFLMVTMADLAGQALSDLDLLFMDWEIFWAVLINELGSFHLYQRMCKVFGKDLESDLGWKSEFIISGTLFNSISDLFYVIN